MPRAEWLPSAILRIGLVGLLAGLACRREVLAPRPGLLRFSRDTVVFDTLFSTVLSPTQRLWVYNPHRYPVRVLHAFLLKGAQSVYTFVWDGQPGPLQAPYVLGAGDSAQVFLSLRDTGFVDAVREDVLVVQTEAGPQEVLLRATLVAAYVYRDFAFDSVVLSLPTDKPIVIDGYFYAGPAAVLRILPGTRLYFSARRWPSGPLQGELMSGLYVAGRLEALGMPTQPIRCQGWRLEPYYASAPGQWQGFWFFPSSTGNRLLYVEIAQASIGIRVDSVGGSAAPKLYLEGCLIREAANYGLVVQGFSPALPSQPILHAVNTLIYRCGQACAAFVGGGTYRLVHCAFVYDQGDLRRGVTSLVLTDFLRLSESQVQVYPLDFWALNSLFWTSKEDAVVADLRGGPPLQYTFDHCAVRQKQPLPGGGNLYPPSVGLGLAQDAYPLLEGSPLIDAGRYDPVWSPTTDRLGYPRNALPDMGVYEFAR